MTHIHDNITTKFKTYFIIDLVNQLKVFAFELWPFARRFAFSYVLRSQRVFYLPLSSSKPFLLKLLNIQHTHDEISLPYPQRLFQNPAHRQPPGPRARNCGPVMTQSGTIFEKGDLVIGGIVGVANCTASRIPSMEFPDITKARREPACGARKTAPVWGKEKVHSPVNRKKKTVTTNVSFVCLSVCVFRCLSREFYHKRLFHLSFSEV